MKTLQPIYGQSYVGYYLNALAEECEISGVCKNYHGTPVLVNERGEWVPFEKLTEDSYITPPFVEPRLRESVRRFLREEIDKEKFLDKLEALSDEEQEELMTSLLATVEADAENAEENGEIVADEVASEIESWVTGEETDEETAEEEDDTNEEVTNDIEETVVSSLEERGVQNSSRLYEMTNEAFIALVQSPEKLARAINHAARNKNIDDPSTWNWIGTVGALGINERQKPTLLKQISQRIDAVLAMAEEARGVGDTEKLKTLKQYAAHLFELQHWVAMSPTKEEANRQTAAVDNINKVKNAADKINQYAHLFRNPAEKVA